MKKFKIFVFVSICFLLFSGQSFAETIKHGVLAKDEVPYKVDLKPIEKEMEDYRILYNIANAVILISFMVFIL